MMGRQKAEQALSVDNMGPEHILWGNKAVSGILLHWGSYRVTEDSGLFLMAMMSQVFQAPAMTQKRAERKGKEAGTGNKRTKSL